MKNEENEWMGIIGVSNRTSAVRPPVMPQLPENVIIKSL